MHAFALKQEGEAEWKAYEEIKKCSKDEENSKSYIRKREVCRESFQD